MRIGMIRQYKIVTKYVVMCGIKEGIGNIQKGYFPGHSRLLYHSHALFVIPAEAGIQF